jgi:hypothetical protein
MALLYAGMWSIIHLLTFFLLYSVGSSDTLEGLGRCGGERCVPRRFGLRRSSLGAASEIGATINIKYTAELADSLEKRKVPDNRAPRYLYKESSTYFWGQRVRFSHTFNRATWCFLRVIVAGKLSKQSFFIFILIGYADGDWIDMWRTILIKAETADSDQY